MSFYVLEIMCGEWRKDSISDVSPFRITWEVQESGYVISTMFAKAVMESQYLRVSPLSRFSMGFHFYKYKKPFSFDNLKRNEKPTPVSNVYIPSKRIDDIDIDKRDGYLERVMMFAIKRLETDKNGGEITAISDEEIK